VAQLWLAGRTPQPERIIADHGVYPADALACPCGGKLRFVALVTESETAKEILQSMGLPTELPPIARARSPDFDFDPPLSDSD